MKKVKVGQPVPDIELQATGGKISRISDLRGRHLVLYFYPKDNTSGCTTEGLDFREHHARFRRAKTEILGVSRDSLRSHETFKAKHRFPFELVSDPDEKLCRLFGVIKQKTLYGRKYLGIERSTFVIDAQGILRAEFRGVKVAGHAAAVLAEVRAL